MLASRERAAGSSARAALLRKAEASTSTAPSTAATTEVREIRAAGSGPAAQPSAAKSADPKPSPGAPASGAPGSSASAPSTDIDPADTLARLREAKRRARGG